MKNIPFFWGTFYEKKKKNICTHTRAHIYIYIYTYISIVYFLRSLRLCISELHMYKYIRIYRVSGKKMVQEVVLLV